MKKTVLSCLAIAALALTACDEQSDTNEESPEPVAEAESELLDASKLYQVGNLSRPSTVFNPAEALTLANISGTQVGSEGFVPIEKLGSSLLRARSTHWEVLRRPATGDLQVVGREELWSPPDEDPSIDP